MGGAIFFNHNGTLIITGSNFNGNATVGGAGAAGGGSGLGLGGAIFNLNGTVSIDTTTITGNSATEGGGVYNLGYGLLAKTAALKANNSYIAVNASIHDVVNNQQGSTALATLIYAGSNAIGATSNLNGSVTALCVPDESCYFHARGCGAGLAALRCAVWMRRNYYYVRSHGHDSAGVADSFESEHDDTGSWGRESDDQRSEFDADFLCGYGESESLQRDREH